MWSDKVLVVLFLMACKSAPAKSGNLNGENLDYPQGVENALPGNHRNNFTHSTAAILPDAVEQLPIRSDEVCKNVLSNLSQIFVSDVLSYVIFTTVSVYVYFNIFAESLKPVI